MDAPSSDPTALLIVLRPPQETMASEASGSPQSSQHDGKFLVFLAVCGGCVEGLGAAKPATASASLTTLAS